MSKIESFEDLVVWKEARELVVLVYKSFQRCKDYAFKDQIQKAAISVMNNISEGFERGSNAEFVRFLFYSKGSAGEVRSMTYVALDLGYITNEVEISSSISNPVQLNRL